MAPHRQISIQDLWKEHVLSSVNWDLLAENDSAGSLWYVGICVDLFLGGTLEHQHSTGVGLECAGCPFAQEEVAGPACQVHLGICEAFMEGLSGQHCKAIRDVNENRCTIILRAIEQDSHV